MNTDKKHFYKQVFALILPMALQNLINTGVNAADVFMLGRVNETVLAGSSLAGQVQFIMTFFLFGITSGATVLTAQYFGKGDYRRIEKIMAMTMLAAVSAGLLFAAAALLIPETLLHIYTNDPAVILEGKKYLSIVAFSYVLSAMTQVYLFVMRSMKRVKIATAVYTTSFFVNLIGNSLFIFGLFGLPALGIRGAALATLISRCLEFAIVCVYARRKDHVVRFHFSDMLHIDKLLLRDLIVYAAPVVANELLWGLGSSMNSAILGHLGSAAVAANSVVQTTRQLAFVGGLGVANAAGVFVGNAIGKKDIDGARAMGMAFFKLSILMGCLGSGVILCAAPILKMFVDLSPEAFRYLNFMFYVMAYFILCQTVTTTIIVGIMRAGGDIRYGLMLDACCIWGCSVLCGSLAAFVFHASVPVAYVILMSDEVVKLPLAIRRLRSYRWLNDLTRP